MSAYVSLKDVRKSYKMGQVDGKVSKCEKNDAPVDVETIEW